ncbi:hypothetical protein Goklo_023299, partial [Gossypium klotzschianum]|nr:hypothetical protein [Gossypium klotzschianum]
MTNNFFIGCYYLVDAGYKYCEGFLAPFKGQRYHLNKWCQGYQPCTPKEFFNMKHASARNVIERCFGLLKLRWGILRSPSFYPMRVHNRIIIACCLLHNFILTYMSLDPIEAELGEGLPNNVIDDDEPNIDVVTTNTHEERNDFHGCEADVSLDDKDLSAIQPQPARNQGDSTFSKKKKKIFDASDHISSTSFNDAATLLAENMRVVGVEISRSIASEVLIQQNSEMTIQESAQKLYPTLCEVEGLTEDESYRAL